MVRPDTATEAWVEEMKSRITAEARATGRREAIEGCIYIVEQSLDTVREEAGDLPSGKIGIAAREHVIALLSGYLDAARGDL
jgi:hypothetical protein